MLRNHAPGRLTTQCFPLLTTGLLWLLVSVSILAQPAAATGDLPVLTTVEQIRALTPEQAALAYPFKLRGAVVVPSVRKNSFFFKDATTGICVDRTDVKPQLHAGDEIEASGTTGAGNFAPVAVAHSVRIVDHRTLSRAPLFRFDELVGGAQDSQPIEIRGVVRSTAIAESSGRQVLLLEVDMGGGRITVRVYDFPAAGAEHLVDAEVRIRGVCGTTFNERRQFVGLRLFVNSLEDVIVERLPPSDAFALPLHTMQNVMAFNPGQSLRHRIKVAGTVTYQRRGHGLYLQDGDQGIYVETSQDTAVALGTRVEAIGFSSVGEYSPILQAARFEVAGTGRVPVPRTVNAKQMIAPPLNGFIAAPYDSLLVRIEGRVVDRVQRVGDQMLVLRDGERVFRAFLDDAAESGGLKQLSIGSKVALIGICFVSADKNREPRSFEILLRSDQDVILLEKPSWWNFAHTVRVLGLALVAVLAALAWVALLRKEVKGRTAEVVGANASLNTALAALQRSEAFLQSLIENLQVHIFRKDGQGRYTFANKNWCERHGTALADVLGKTAFDFAPPELAAEYRRSDLAVMESREPFESEYTEILPNETKRWVHIIKVAVIDEEGGVGGVQGMYWDVTERKVAEERLEQANRQLIDTSRQAGMAEIATNVLHNVGNVLNSVNVSAELVVDQVRGSKAPNLGRVCALLDEHQGDLGSFLSTDPKGKLIPGYLGTLVEHLAGERAATIAELENLCKNIGHIRQIVTMQQSYARSSRFYEHVSICDIVEDALRMNTSSIVQHDLELVRDFQVHPTISTDKHQVMQILCNLVGNAKLACDEAGRIDKRIIVRIADAPQSVKISVIDNGVGIPVTNLTRIFNHGFTTRKLGHGFGLHSCAIAATELGGSLVAHSEGPGSGATFILELPLSI